VACPACSNKYTEVKKRAAKAEAHAKRTCNDFTVQEDVSQKSPEVPRSPKAQTRSHYEPDTVECTLVFYGDAVGDSR